MNNIRRLLYIDEIYDKGYDGRNTCVAIIDSGVFPHNDLKGRIIDFKDFTNNRIGLYDDNGHGTHVAGIIGGDGTMSNGLYRGIAPQCNIVVLKTLNARGGGELNDTLRAFRYLIENKKKYKIDIINISIGSSNTIKKEDSIKLIEAVEELWSYGFTVIAAAGNNGPRTNSITIPGSARSIITVGSCDDCRAVNIGEHKKVSNYSGRGPTLSCVLKPEIVCYGSLIMSLDKMRARYTIKSGTSMSTPIVSGVVSLMCQKFYNITNKEIKKIIHDTAINIGLPKNLQGWGLINPKQIML